MNRTFVAGALWGVIGMILAIPVLAIPTLVFLNARPQHPLGFLFSKDSSSDDTNS